MSLSFQIANASFLALLPQKIDDAAIQQLLKPLEKLEEDIQAKIESIQNEKSQPYHYSLGTRVMAFMALKFAWGYGATKYIINPAANAAFEFTAKKLSVNAASSLFLRTIPWIVYIFAVHQLGTICNDTFNYLVGSAVKSDKVFKAIRIIAELEKMNEARYSVHKILDTKIQQTEQLQESIGQSIKEKLQTKDSVITEIMSKTLEFHKKHADEHQLEEGQENYIYFATLQLILG